MFLSRSDILAAYASGALTVLPFHPKYLKPASCIMHLGDRVRYWRNRSESMDVWSERSHARHMGPIQRMTQITVHRQDFVLAETIEAIALTEIIGGVICNLSHLARFGIQIHGGAFWVNPGYGNNRPTRLTLEITSSNPSPIKMSAGMPVCHLAFYKVSCVGAGEYRLKQSVYEGGDPLQEPRLFEELRDFWMDPVETLATQDARSQESSENVIETALPILRM